MSAHTCSLLRRLGLGQRGFAELIASYRLGSEVRIQPLGVWVTEGCRLAFDAYKGTRLYGSADMLVDICLAATCDPRDYARAVMEPTLLGTVPSKAVSSPCPRVRSGFRVEAVVASRRPLGEVVRFELYPVYVQVDGDAAAYTRSLGCAVEILVAYTRAVAAARAVAAGVEQRDPWCRRLGRYAAVIGYLLECVERTAADEEVVALAREAAAGFNRYRWLAGCPPED